MAKPLQAVVTNTFFTHRRMENRLPLSPEMHEPKLHVETSLTKKVQYGILLRLLISIKAARQRQRKTGPVKQDGQSALQLIQLLKA
ncbi:hypothetical protein H7Q97_01450 [Ochrobactrum sp. CM-21-5]|nr:hypothetical protein [Ochrobactrum sp. CM-21-5]MBC2884065.1 hypothetical protein [Ochrobactrum sp. CM-21-5]